MTLGSVSRKQLILEIKNKAKIQCDLKRHLSPRTVGSIMRSLPLEGNVHFLGTNVVYFETPVDSGIERSKNEFKKWDVAFLPGSGSICFFLNDVTSTKSMTPLGKLSGEVDNLCSVKSGDILRLYEDTAL
ncbi:MAG: hypothetical protein KC483_05200 [Nitrosarchaeum sp.]|nr:hypothetical protein [Nitrosarchaeum sp.]